MPSSNFPFLVSSVILFFFSIQLEGPDVMEFFRALRKSLSFICINCAIALFSGIQLISISFMTIVR